MAESVMGLFKTELLRNPASARAWWLPHRLRRPCAGQQQRPRTTLEPGRTIELLTYALRRGPGPFGRFWRRLGPPNRSYQDGRRVDPVRGDSAHVRPASLKQRGVAAVKEHRRLREAHLDAEATAGLWSERNGGIMGFNNG